jgi:putative FmdB family regulatory protein
LPLYEYQCPQCGTFERMQKFSDPILTACPTCNGPVEKLLSAPAIQFKGSGWYVTDYAKKALGQDKGGEGKDKASEKKDTSSSKGEAKKTESSPKSDKGTSS